MATRELGPSGVALSESRLSDDTMEHLRDSLESKGLGNKNLDPFFDELNNVFSVYFSVSSVRSFKEPHFRVFVINNEPSCTHEA